MKRRLTTAGAARAAGIGRATLHRWISSRKIKPPKASLRNGRGVRLWSKADIERLRKVKERTYRKGRGRKKKKG